jgi:hypothetical protein
VFCIWIGFGVPHTKVLKIYSPKNCSTSNHYRQLTCSPVLMASNWMITIAWEIHGVSYGKAYLYSDPNAIHLQFEIM